MGLSVFDLGLMPYRKAWAAQEEAHANVMAGEGEMILLVEHPPVITVGRRGLNTQYLLSSLPQLEHDGIEFIQSDRGGDITLHAPGQIVAYPILNLCQRKLSAGAYVHRLERCVIATLGEFGIQAQTDPSAVGVWTMDGTHLAKVCAIGVRIRRGVSLHGLALNVCNNLSLFNHIVPCGLQARPVTSIAKLLGNRAPTMQQVKSTLTSHLVQTWEVTTALARESCP